MKREVLLAEARKHVWAAWQLSAEELASQAVATLHDMGMLVPEGTAPQLEKLAEQVVSLQAELAEAVRAAAVAVRERDLMRERVSEPFGCAHCGAAKRVHGRRYIGGVGMHGWERPSDEQVKDRMLARRAARMPARSAVKPGSLLGRARDVVEARVTKDALRLVLENVIVYAAELEAELYTEQAHGRTLLEQRNAHAQELLKLRPRVAELEAAAQAIVHLHKDSPMGPCPVCIDGDAMVRGDDYTLPYPCPTARLAGAKDCDPPSRRKAPRPPAGPKPTPMTVYLGTPCATCDHTLSWHRNDVGCTVDDCACGRFAEPASMGGDA
ncbi:hypothetical protein ACFT8V_03755 [Streptomyces griseoincarnatus]